MNQPVHASPNTPPPSSQREGNPGIAIVTVLLITLCLGGAVWYMFRGPGSNRPPSDTTPASDNDVQPAPRAARPPTGPPPAAAARAKPRKLFATIEAEVYDQQSGISDRPSYIGYVDGGDWLLYKGIDFADGPTHFVAFLSKLRENSEVDRIEARIDSVTGPLIASFRPEVTGDWKEFRAQMTSTLTGVTGVHDLYLTFVGPRAVGNIDWVKFLKLPREATGRIDATSYDDQRGLSDDETALSQIDQGDSVRYSQVRFGDGVSTLKISLAAPDDVAGVLEVRLDSIDSPPIGNLALSSTGGLDKFQIYSIKFDMPITGVHDVHFTFTGGRNLGNLEWFQFQE